VIEPVEVEDVEAEGGEEGGEEHDGLGGIVSESSLLVRRSVRRPL